MVRTELDAIDRERTQSIDNSAEFAQGREQNVYL